MSEKVYNRDVYLIESHKEQHAICQFNSISVTGANKSSHVYLSKTL